jgi:mRNA interferase MazF
LTQIPFAGIPVLKRCPAVVLSSLTFNTANGATLVVVITSTTQDPWPSDIVLNDLDTAGLQTPCRVRWRVTTIPNDLIIRKIGRLSGIDKLRCERELANMIA